MDTCAAAAHTHAPRDHARTCHLPQTLLKFNQGIGDITLNIQLGCHASNCANFTRTLPSRRADIGCATGRVPINVNNANPCRGVVWNYNKPVACTYLGSSNGQTVVVPGVCDTNSNKQSLCYSVCMMMNRKA